MGQPGSPETALLAALAKSETEGQLADRLLFYSKKKLLLIDELGRRLWTLPEPWTHRTRRLLTT